MEDAAAGIGAGNIYLGYGESPGWRRPERETTPRLGWSVGDEKIFSL